MARAPNAIFATVVLAACAADAVAPTAHAVDQPVTPLAAPAIAPPAASITKLPASSKTAGLDDALARLVPSLGTSGLSLQAPLTLLRADLTVANSTAREALLAAAEGVLAHVEAIASGAQQADVDAIRLALDVIRYDFVASGAGQ